MDIFTIGHSNHPLEKFLELLQQNCIDCLIDVRSSPFSRYCEQFNQSNLETSLPGQGIEYKFLGRQLGGRPREASCYFDNVVPDGAADFLHKVNYPKVMTRPWFLEGIAKIQEVPKVKTIALMCSEEDPQKCHRHHLIAKYLISNYPTWEILHIRGDGTVISAKDLNDNLAGDSARKTEPDLQPTLFNF